MNDNTAESNLYQLVRTLANERAVAAGLADEDAVVLPDRSKPGFARRRPVLSGCAIGPAGTHYGTLGVSVVVATTADPPEWMHWDASVSRGEVLYTTNRHVLDGDHGQAVYQPGHITTPDNQIGEVVGYADLAAERAPDVAFLRLDGGVSWGGYLDADHMGRAVAHDDGGGDATGQPSRLCGANSGVANGKIKATDATCAVNYGGHGTITKRGLLRATDNSRGGDSGSPSDSGPDDARLRGLNFASGPGFHTGNDSWKVPVGLIEQAGVRVLDNEEFEDPAAVLSGGGGGGGTAGPENWDPNPDVPWPPDSPEPDPDPDMKDLTIDATDKQAGPTWYFVDTDGSAKCLDDTEDPDDVKQAPSGDTRMSGKVVAGAGNTDSFAFSGSLTNAHFSQHWHGIEVRVDGEARAIEDLPGFDAEQPAPDPPKAPEGHEGGFRIGDAAQVRQVPDARDRDEVAVCSPHETDLWVAPGDKGSDDADGSFSDPLATLTEAVRRIPEVCYHYCLIHLLPGEHHNPERDGLTLTTSFNGYFTQRGDRRGLEVVGAGDDPTQTVVKGYPQMNVHADCNGSYQVGRFRNLTLETSFTVDNCKFGVDECIIKPMKTDDFAIGGYSNTVFLRKVHVEAAYLAMVKEGGEVTCNRVTGRVSERPIKGRHATFRVEFGNDLDYPGDSWTDGCNPQLPINVIDGLDDDTAP